MTIPPSVRGADKNSNGASSAPKGSCHLGFRVFFFLREATGSVLKTLIGTAAKRFCFAFVDTGIAAPSFLPPRWGRVFRFAAFPFFMPGRNLSSYLPACQPLFLPALKLLRKLRDSAWAGKVIE